MRRSLQGDGPALAGGEVREAGRNIGEVREAGR